MEEKIEKCKFSWPSLEKDGEDMVVRYICKKEGWEKEGKEISCADCESCEHFRSRYIEYPISVSKIEQRDIEYNDSSRIGSLVKIRPCGEEYKNKTYLGIYLGDLPTSPHMTYNNVSEVLTVGAMTNPAIYVFELKKIIFGYESWWGVIENENELKDITDEDIGNVWYVQLLKSLTEGENNNEW